MGTEPASQFSVLCSSLLLGVGYVLLYDALRPLRTRAPRRLAAALDGLFCAFLLLSLFSFTLRVGQGELRLYMLFAIIGAAMFSFSVLSPLFRPLWQFWAAVLTELLRLLLLPFRAIHRLSANLHKLSQRHFLFHRRCFIIRRHCLVSRRIGRTIRRKG